MSVTAEQMGLFIKEARKNAGLTQQDVAQAVGVSVQAVSKWEVGQSMPDTALLPDIADCLGLTLDALFGRREMQERLACLPDDGQLRVTQFLGRRLLRADERAEDAPPIPLAFDEAVRRALTPDEQGRLRLAVLVEGDAAITGGVQGEVRADAGNVNCWGKIAGGVHAQGDVICWGNIAGGVHAQGDVIGRGDIAGDIHAQGGVNCSKDILGDVRAGGDVICQGGIRHSDS